MYCVVSLYRLSRFGGCHLFRTPFQDTFSGHLFRMWDAARGAFWVASPEMAAEQIFTAIRRRKEHAYITRRWRLMAWVVKLAPDWLYYRLG